MKTWKEYILLAQADLGVSSENMRAPISVYKYVGLTPEGEKVEFDSPQEMTKAGYQVNRNAVRICANQKEVGDYWKLQGKIEEYASNTFHIDLRAEYPHLSDEVYNLSYSEAYDRGHSYGYDEVASYMEQVVSFAEAILKTKG